MNIQIAIIALAAAALLAVSGAANAKENSVAVFAGGCFWCMEPPFKNLKGVIKVTSGYTGGETANPTYGDVTTQTTGHYEAVKVEYDPATVTYEKLLETFWKNIDPTDPGGQFADRGPSYKTAIFVQNEDQKKKAEKSKTDLDASGKFGKPVATLILPAAPFYPAEEYHQDYKTKNPMRYRLYREGSGRGPFLEKNWGEEK